MIPTRTRTAAAALSLWLAPALQLHALDYTAALDTITASSPALRAAEALAEAECAGASAGLNLANPEVEFSYQWGSPSAATPDKKTLEVTQEFDFGTLSGAKRRTAHAENNASRARLALTRRDIRAQADALMTEIVYRRRLRANYDSTLHLTGLMLQAAEAALERNQYTLVEVNTIRIERNAITAEARVNEIDLQASLSALATLAGGKLPEWAGSDYMPFALPSACPHECASPEVLIAEADAALARENLSLTRSEGLPTFTLGYTAEYVKGANYNGAAVGLELPLWANKGKVKAARLASEAARIEAETARTLHLNELEALRAKARALGTLAADSRRLRDTADLRPTLRSLFDKGLISIHDYLSQLQPLVEMDRRVLEAERDYQQALAAYRAKL